MRTALWLTVAHSIWRVCPTPLMQGLHPGGLPLKADPPQTHIQTSVPLQADPLCRPRPGCRPPPPMDRIFDSPLGRAPPRKTPRSRSPSPHVDRILARRLWKHYLPTTTVAVSNNTYCIPLISIAFDSDASVSIIIGCLITICCQWQRTNSINWWDTLNRWEWGKREHKY